MNKLKITVFNSNSKGNSILLDFETKRFLLDAGYNLSFFKTVNFNKLNYVLISHEHKDHIAYLKTLNKKYKNHKIILPEKLIPVFLEWEILNDYELNRIEKNNTWLNRITVEHDCIENNAYIIKDENINFAYLTDAKEIPNEFTKLIIEKEITNIIIELNHDKEIIENLIKEKNLIHHTRIKNAHLNNEKVYAFLNQIKSNKHKKNILLTHKSKENTNDNTYIRILNDFKTFFNVEIALGNKIILWEKKT